LSVSRAELKNVRALHSKKGRQAAGQFLAEGVRLLEETNRFKARPLKVYFAPSLLNERGLAVVEQFRGRKVIMEETSASDLSRIGPARTSQGIAAVFSTPATDLDKLYHPRMRNILLCESLSDPGNVGTLCRSALAFGFDLMILSGTSAEPYGPKVVRASVGAVFGLSVALASTEDALALAQAQKMAVVAADVRGKDRLGRVLKDIERRKLLLALGAEAAGLSPEIRQRAEYTVSVRHERTVESLNAAVAGSILMNRCYAGRVRRKR
jgi:TrmH family RNA methyltransferase